ncbi:MAG: Holliday junction resolvase RuvX [Verrucomicrobiota bacterium JB023]|nr:Holliday junction resolvase RuvX [Verrucomicrobiota bacterium JB023]
MEASHPILCIDYGAARVGLAATDDLAISVHPVETIPAEIAVDEVVRIVEERKVKTLLLGLPLRLDGSEGDSAKKVRAFGDRLAKALPDLPLLFHDEAFSTVSAAEKLRSAGKKAKSQKGIIDQAAAMEILRNYLGW